MNNAVRKQARKCIEAMHGYLKLRPSKGAVQWIEDDQGRVVIFTRGEYRDTIMEAVREKAPYSMSETEFWDGEHERESK